MSAHVSLRMATALSRAAHWATAGALKCWQAYLNASHESRRREAASLIAQYSAAPDPTDSLLEGADAPRGRRRAVLSESEILFLKSNSKAPE